MSYPDVCSIAERSKQNLSDTGRLVALGELAAGVAHNFGNVLMGVSLTLELLQVRAVRDPGLSDMIEAISGAQAEVTRGAEIIQRLLSLAGGNPSTLIGVNPWLAADNALTLCSTHINAKRVRLVNLIPTDPPSVKADASQLEEVMVNLILNALQASERGEVRVDLEDTGDDRVKIRISDNGCGIAPEDMDKIFDPFFTRRKEGAGTGLGLTCSLGQVTRMGGAIEVESRLGIGSTFTIVLSKWNNE